MEECTINLLNKNRPPYILRESDLVWARNADKLWWPGEVESLVKSKKDHLAVGCTFYFVNFLHEELVTTCMLESDVLPYFRLQKPIFRILKRHKEAREILKSVKKAEFLMKTKKQSKNNMRMTECDTNVTVGDYSSISCVADSIKSCSDECQELEHQTKVKDSGLEKGVKILDRTPSAFREIDKKMESYIPENQSPLESVSSELENPKKKCNNLEKKEEEKNASISEKYSSSFCDPNMKERNSLPQGPSRKDVSDQEKRVNQKTKLEMTGKDLGYMNLMSELQFKRQRKFIRLLMLLQKHLNENTFVLKRQILYYVKIKDEDTKEIDYLINKATKTLGATRTELHILSMPKGVFSGVIQVFFKTGRSVIYGETREGNTITAEFEHIVGIISDAKTVIVVEKTCTFFRLVEDGIHRKIPNLILVSGSGVCDFYTRFFVNKLYYLMKVEIFGLMDNDPYGILILMLYRFGSENPSYEKDKLNCPVMRWLGIRPSDLIRLKLSCSNELSENDIMKLNDLLQKYEVKKNKDFKRELHLMKKTNRKMSIDEFYAACSSEKFFRYISSKIRRDTVLKKS